MSATIDAERTAFEDACLVRFAIARAAGTATGDNDCPPTREALFWRQVDGMYGVQQFNAAWWGWMARATVGAMAAMPQGDQPWQ